MVAVFWSVVAPDDVDPSPCETPPPMAPPPPSQVAPTWFSCLVLVRSMEGSLVFPSVVDGGTVDAMYW